MIEIKEYRGHIRNWEALCKELGIDKALSREKREEAPGEKEHEAGHGQGAAGAQKLIYRLLHPACPGAGGAGSPAVPS